MLLPHPDDVLAAFRCLDSELPGLVGDTNWPGLQAILRDLQASTTPAERQKLAENLIAQVISNQQVHSAFQRELRRIQDYRFELEQSRLRGYLEQALYEPLVDFCQRTGIPLETVKPSLQKVVQSFVLEPLHADEQAVLFERVILSKPGGIGGARSHKLANFRLVLNDAFELAAGAVVPAIAGPTPLAVAFAIWATVHFLYGAIRRELNEEQATVLWGVILACQGERQIAEEEAIVDQINQQRKVYGLPTLEPNRIRHILNQLRADRVIRQPINMPKAWQLAEKFVVVPNDQNVWQVLDQVLG